MSDETVLKILGKRESRNLKLKQFLQNKKEELRDEINTIIGNITRGDQSKINLLNATLDAIDLKRVSRKKLRFLDHLKNYNDEVLRDAIAGFLFSALEKHDKKKGTKSQLFLGVLRNTDKNFKSSEPQIKPITQEEKNKINNRIQHYLDVGIDPDINI